MVSDSLAVEVSARPTHTEAVELLPPTSSSSRPGTGRPESPKWSDCRPDRTSSKVPLGAGLKLIKASLFQSPHVL